MIINNDEEHRDAVHELDVLLEKDPELNTPPGLRLVELCEAIEDYEDQVLGYPG